MSGEGGGHYGSTTTSRSRMPPPPVLRTRMILQWSESCAQLVGTRTSLPTPSLVLNLVRAGMPAGNDSRWLIAASHSHSLYASLWTTF
jgi:hypothetical protein